MKFINLNNFSINSLAVNTTNKAINNCIYALLGSVLLALSAQITIPYQIVPMTLQGFTVLLLAFLLGPTVGSMSVIFYLFEGLLGLPVFAGYSFGFAILLGPTSGYLLGFLPAVFVTGHLLKTKFASNFFGRLLISLLGMSLIFIFGYSVLSLFVGYKTAFIVGVMPFVIIDFVKTLIITCISKQK